MSGTEENSCSSFGRGMLNLVWNNCVHRQCFSRNIPITESCLSVMQCHLRAWRSQASSMVFRPWFLALTGISPDSQNLLIILRTVNHDIFNLCVILHWGTFFWNCSTICRHGIRGIGDPLPIFTTETLQLWCSFYTQSLLTCCQLT